MTEADYAVRRVCLLRTTYHIMGETNDILKLYRRYILLGDVIPLEHLRRLQFEYICWFSVLPNTCDTDSK